jgi:predicted dehydrogenase
MMNERLRWGTLGSSRFLQDWSFPEISRSKFGELVAVASRTQEGADRLASKLGTPRAYGSYQALIADPEVEVVYNALPNSEHAEWSLKALEAGKHVLCEKPLTASSKESIVLAKSATRFSGYLFEGYMWRHHHQWGIAKSIIDSGRLGSISFGIMHYCYDDSDPASTRNSKMFGGGALRMIGCYPITMFQFLFGKWPSKVLGYVDEDERFGIDRLACAFLAFDGAVAQISVSTQLWDQQSLTVYGPKGWMRLDTPVTPAAQVGPTITVEDASGTEIIQTAPQSQFASQVDAICEAISNHERPQLEDGIRALRVIEDIERSGSAGRWVESP